MLLITIYNYPLNLILCRFGRIKGQSKQLCEDFDTRNSKLLKLNDSLTIIPNSKIWLFFGVACKESLDPSFVFYLLIASYVLE